MWVISLYALHYLTLLFPTLENQACFIFIIAIAMVENRRKFQNLKFTISLYNLFHFRNWKAALVHKCQHYFLKMRWRVAISLQCPSKLWLQLTSQISAFKNCFRSLSFQSLQNSRHVRIKEPMFASSDACSGQTFGSWQSWAKMICVWSRSKVCGMEW